MNDQHAAALWCRNDRSLSSRAEARRVMIDALDGPRVHPRRTRPRAFIALVAVIVAGLGFLPGRADAAATHSWSRTSAGAFHTCAIDTHHLLYCWGLNDSSQLGDGTDKGRITPRRISLDEWTSVAAGADTTCGIRSEGKLYCWGDNRSGTVGIGTSTASEPIPRRIAGNSQWTSVSVGEDHACAVTSSHRLYCWGSNGRGELGRVVSATTDTRHPLRIDATRSWAGVTAAGAGTCARTTGGQLYCWGANSSGRIGNASLDDAPLPVRVGLESDWTNASTQQNNTCGVRGGGRLFCWGADSEGQLGIGSHGVSLTPIAAGPSTFRWTRTAAGFRFACGVRTDGRLYCWGAAGHGQLGTGQTNEQSSPVREATGGDDWSSVTAGVFHACAVRTSHQLYCWGANDAGQLGDGTHDLHAAPHRVM